MSAIGLNSDTQHYQGPELWGPIRGCSYDQVSTHGRTRTRRKRIYPGGRKGTKTIITPSWRMLPQQLKAKRYRIVTVRDDAGVEHTYKVHQLVLLAFVGPPAEGQTECRHLNDVPADNHLGNLAWGTRLENEADKRRNRAVTRAALQQAALTVTSESFGEVVITGVPK